MKDSEGRKTATVFGLVLTPQTTKGYSTMLQKDLIDLQLPVLNSYWMQGDGRLENKRLGRYYFQRYIRLCLYVGND